MDQTTVVSISPRLSAAPQLCEYLEPLYGFCMRELIDANIRQEAEKVAGVIRVLTPLREAWVIAVQKAAEEQASPAR